MLKPKLKEFYATILLAAILLTIAFLYIMGGYSMYVIISKGSW